MRLGLVSTLVSIGPEKQKSLPTSEDFEPESVAAAVGLEPTTS